MLTVSHSTGTEKASMQLLGNILKVTKESNA